MTILHQNLDRLPDAAKNCAIAIGNFDGLHKGHRVLIARAQSVAKQLGVPLGVLTFSPHPRRFFQPNAEPFLITRMPMKQRLMQEMGVDHLFALAFDETVARMAPKDFIEQILIKDLRIRHAVVGHDFAFGKDRAGNIDTLKGYTQRFTLDIMEPITARDGAVFSSSAARECLHAGNFEAAENILGWPWQIEGPVMKGDQRGRTLGYPTANQDMDGYVRPPFGIYAVKALVESETTWRNGVANIGIRPMFPSKAPLCETHIFDFSSEIYGKMLRVMPIGKLRDEMRFDNAAALMAQMKEDCIQALAMLESRRVNS